MNTMLVNAITKWPPHAYLSPARSGPATQKERSVAIDVLRGVAILGILMLNIESFGTPEVTHDIPIAAISTFAGHHTTLDLAIIVFKWVLFEGKMRGLFSMLFGAGAILLTSRAEARGTGAGNADIYTRRNLWLLIFGLLHGCFLWEGDILFDYALVALTVLYPCRNLKPKTLIYVGTLISLISTYGALNFLGASNDWSMDAQVKVIHADQQAGHTVTPAQKQILQAWDERVKSQTVTKETVAAAVADVTKPYWQGVADRVQLYIGAGAGPLHFMDFVDPLSLMLIGMGLYKLGFLTGELSYATYARTAFAGFLVSTPIYLFGLWKAYQGGFNFLATETWLFAPYYLTREVGTLAIVSVVLIIIKSKRLRGLQLALANVGKTALTNYLMTTVLCNFIFIWGPWPLYAKLEYYQLLYVVFAIWGLNLILSSLWLQVFQFGPFEWMWRSLTYVKLQPMRRRLIIPGQE